MKNYIFVILIIAFVLRFWGIGNLDILGDESAYAFRSIGYIDYLGTSFQTQPIDWYKDSPPPFWTKLSFHDHPPLVFLIQNLFFRIFGDSLVSARLPGITFGTASVFLVYLLFRKFLVNETLALLAGFLFAVNPAMVWISRSALMEPVLIFLILLNIYFFFRFLEDRKFWLSFGLTLGLIALTKYIGVFLLPVYIVYLVYWSHWSNRSYWLDWRLYAAFLVALLVFSPVIIYNLYLYQTRGHFDLQISYLLGQDTPEWTGLLGKIQSPFADIGKNLSELYGWPMLIVVLFGLFYWTYPYKQINADGNAGTATASIFIGLYLLFSTLLFVKIGVANRFITFYGPVFVILAATAINQFWKGYFGKLAVVIFLIWEIAFSVNKNLINLPDYGIAKLDNYFEQEFKNKESAVIPESDNFNLNTTIHKFAEKKSKNPRQMFLVVYNDNIALPTLQWIFYRRFFYHSIPAMYVENFEKILNARGPDYFKGFDIYFVQSTENTLLNLFKTEKTAGLDLENSLRNRGLQPAKIIYGHDDLEMFRIYKFSL